MRIELTAPSVASFIGKTDTLRWTTHMDECLATLERSGESQSDEVLCTLIKLQLIADEAQKLLVRDVMGDLEGAPTYAFKKGMLHRLQEIRSSITTITASNCEYMLLKVFLVTER